MTTWTVHAKRWDRGWELRIDGLGVTQSRTLRHAPAMAADYIELETGTKPEVSEIEIVPEVGDGLAEEALAARRAVADADRAQREAASRSHVRPPVNSRAPA